MTASWSNLLAWSLQIALITMAGTLLPRIFALKIARSRLLYWRGMLLLCLALPLIQPWIQPIGGDAAVSFSTGPIRTFATQPAHSLIPSWSAMLVVVLAAGILLRLFRLVFGVLKIRRCYRRAKPLDSQILPGIEVLVSRDVSSPVTFGIRPPIILLPARFAQLEADAQQSILFHEMIHIERRDWPVAIAEEILRAILWFHPAIWWILGQVQLAREQVVDQAVIERTGNRQRYLDALLTIASFRLSADLAPAPLFLKKRHLRQRVESLISGVPMTKRNLLLPLAAAFATLPLITGVAIWQFPLRAAPQDVVDDPGVDVQLGQAKLLHRTPVVYPERARAQHISGTVAVDVSLDEKGEVTDAVGVSGPEDLRKAVVQSVLNWHFSMEGGQARKFPIAVSFGQNGTAVQGPVTRSAAAMIPDAPRTVDAFNLDRLPPALKEKVAQANLVRVGDVMTRDNITALETSLRGIDDHLRLGIAISGDRLSLSALVAGPQAAQGSTPKSIRVGGKVQAVNLITKVVPKYPPDAKQARIQGTVRFDATIAADGTIKNLDVVSGHPLLVAAALDAVRQWVYKPTLLNGTPVEVLTVIDVNFTLNQ